MIAVQTLADYSVQVSFDKIKLGSIISNYVTSVNRKIEQLFSF